MKTAFFKRHPFVRKALVVIAVLAVMGLVFAGESWRMLSDAVRGDTVVVPEVIGMPLAEARSHLQEAGLDALLSEQSSVFSDFVMRGGIAVQDPAPGSQVKRARVVELVLSRGSRKETIPDLTGLSVEEAAEVARSYQMRLTGVDHVHDVRPVGTVIAQTPAPGHSGIVDNRIKLLVSDGPMPNRYVMPDLAMRPLVEVERELKKSGVPYVVKTFANQIEDRNILFVKEQYPLPGHMMSEDDIVTLKVVEREFL